MRKELAEGVHLNISTIKKFKTISIRIQFKSKIESDQITSKALLANMLSTNSQHYPTQTDFRGALSSLYGAQFSVDVEKAGNVHLLTLEMDIVDDQFLVEKNIFEKAMLFLKNVLFYPNASDCTFHGETFEREVVNLKDEYASLYEDKQEYAGVEASKLYFDTLEQKIPAWGRSEDLEKITPKSLYKVYEQMLSSDQITITILGDIDENRVTEVLKSFDFKDRSLIGNQIFYKDKIFNGVKRKTEYQEIAQSKLNLVFDASIYYHEDLYYAGQVFNGLFGGFSHSKLFTVVREEHGLAYDIVSGIDSYNGILYVQSGIDHTQYETVEKMILKQLKRIQEGDFSKEIIEQSKSLLKSALFQSEDYADSIIERQISFELIDQPLLSLEEWKDKINAVTKSEIIEIAKTIKLKAVFLLSGGLR
ncbi:EF-P 5-aminopentanol modification-associated protein YfmF [Marinilactibacillus kalidii]|uniref:EF-P 5-aminopentanol modification-associated protein YfmF n=1 Tax=Marinilactibacillus kalidii TaxID=2820274 RepID=UPI001ABE98CE|nr:pitrilysin family protein [Marinilactibacillus kalidii]